MSAAEEQTSAAAAGPDGQRIEAAARALARDAAPESSREHWGTQPQWLKDKFRRRAALVLAAADAADPLRTGSSRAPAPEPSRDAAPAMTAGDGRCEGDCRGSRCSYCGCCMHTGDSGNCRTAAAPEGMSCPEYGCGCEGTV